MRFLWLMCISFFTLLQGNDSVHDNKLLPVEVQECVYAVIYTAQQEQLPLEGNLLALSNQEDIYNLVSVLYDECKQIQLIVDTLQFIKKYREKLADKLHIPMIVNILQTYIGDNQDHVGIESKTQKPCPWLESGFCCIDNDEEGDENSVSGVDVSDLQQPKLKISCGLLDK